MSNYTNHIIIYNDEFIKYYEGELNLEKIKPNVFEYESCSIYGNSPYKQKTCLDSGISYIIQNYNESNSIKLDPILMKRIAKYNLEVINKKEKQKRQNELKKLDKQIKLKENKLKKLNSILEDKEKEKER